MKNLFLRAASAVLSITLTASTFAITSSALYKGVLGDVYYAHSRQIGAGVDYTEYRSITDGLNEHAYIFEYRPNEGSLPLVCFGENLIGSTRTSVLADFAAQKGYNVLGGVNGDFYSMYTGIPMGAIIQDGRIISDDDKNSAVGFTYDGETVFGSPQISFSIKHTYKPKAAEPENNDAVNASSFADTAEIEDTTEVAKNASTEQPENADIPLDVDETISTQDDTEDNNKFTDEPESVSQNKLKDIEDELITEELPTSYFNKYPSEWGAYLLDSMYADSTKSAKPSLEIVITLDEPESYPKAGSTLTGIVSAVNSNITDTEILPGTMVISVCEMSSYRASYNNVKPGDSIEIEFNVAEAFENVKTAIGGSDVFIKDGVINEAAFDEAHEKTANPRTAIGVRADGTVLFFAVDGRSDESYGLRMISLAKTLESFGCVFAMNLDGGGSTTAVVKLPGTENPIVVNNPSDYAERSVSNALLLVNKFSSDNKPKYIIPTDTAPVILSGDTYTFDGNFYDIALKAIDFDKLETDGTPVLTAEDVKLEFDMSRLSYYTDETMPDLGTISEDLRTYTADGITGEIPLLFTAKYGEETLTGRVILYVAAKPDKIEADVKTCEYITDVLEINYKASYMGSAVPARINELAFELTEFEVRNAGNANTEEKLSDCSLGYIDVNGNFKAYDDADGSLVLTISLGNTVCAKAFIVIGSGSVTVLDSREINYDFPEIKDIEEADEVTESTPESDESTEATQQSNESAEEALLEDDDTVRTDFNIASELLLDGARSIELYASESDLQLSASAIDKNGDLQDISYTRVQGVKPDKNGNVIYRAVLNDGYTKLASALYIDSELNAGDKGSLKIDYCEVNYDDAEIIFPDTIGHWARKNINALYREGIVGGESVDDSIVYNPERSLTRAEFAAMIARVLKLDINANVSDIAFDDFDKISEWALPYVHAVSAKGIMNGKMMADGALYFDANGNITRQEIMQVIGNIVKLKKAENNIDAEQAETEYTISFADASDIADWAFENVGIAVNLGIITGYDDNTIRPARNVTRAEAATVILRTRNYLLTIDRVLQ